MNIVNKNLKFTNTLYDRVGTTAIVIHHVGVCGDSTVDNIHKYHIENNKWSGIGYHFFVDKTGIIYRGRPIDKTGAHCLNHNHDTIGICLAGNFDEEIPTNNQMKSLSDLVDFIEKYYCKTLKIYRHCDLTPTGCPGKNFSLSEIRIFQKDEPEQPQSFSKNARDFVEKYKIMSDGRYLEPVTREELAVTLYRLYNLIK